MQKSWLQLSIDIAFLQVVLTVLAIILPKRPFANDCFWHVAAQGGLLNLIAFSLLLAKWVIVFAVKSGNSAYTTTRNQGFANEPSDKNRRIAVFNCRY